MTETTRTYRSTLPVPVDDLERWHENPGALERLTPPWMNVRIRDAGGITPGETATLRVPIAGPLGFDWTLEHEALPDGRGFADVQVKGPFESWRHEHRFESVDHGSSMLTDDLRYALPAQAIAGPLAGGRIGKQLDDLFRFRHQRTRNDLARLRDAGKESLHIAVTGASGLVGERLVPFLQGGGHRVSRLVRSSPKGPDEIRWDPSGGTIDAGALEGVDAVIHLAGASISSWPWTESRRTAIRDSRIEGTSLLAKTLAGLDRKPRVFVSTSAVGFYGDRDDEVLTEDSSNGSGFLADVVREWEASARPAAEAGIRVVHPRFGVVMAGEGGMLPLLGMVFKTGLGGRLGNGRQYLAWIALDDLVGILLESVVNDRLEGVVNAVAPQEITNAQFTKVMGKVLRRPTLFQVPSFAMKTVAGGLADNLILVSQRVQPTRLEETGFRFDFPTMEETLRFEFGRMAGGRAADAAGMSVLTTEST